MIGVCVESQIGQVFMADLGGEIVHGRTHGVSYRVAQEAGQTGPAGDRRNNIFMHVKICIHDRHFTTPCMD